MTSRPVDPAAWRARADGRDGPRWGVMAGLGLARGLATTFRRLTRRAVTAQYPDAAPQLPPRSRGVIALTEENCTVCMLCARECPDWCIYIDSHKEELPPAIEGGATPQPQRPRPVRDRLLAVHVLRDLHRGVPVRRAALVARVRVRRARHPRLVHERDRLREWMWTVPPPPALDPNAAEPKEVETARKAAGVSPNPGSGAAG